MKNLTPEQRLQGAVDAFLQSLAHVTECGAADSLRDRDYRFFIADPDPNETPDEIHILKALLRESATQVTNPVLADGSRIARNIQFGVGQTTPDGKCKTIVGPSGEPLLECKDTEQYPLILPLFEAGCLQVVSGNEEEALLMMKELVYHIMHDSDASQLEIYEYDPKFNHAFAAFKEYPNWHTAEDQTSFNSMLSELIAGVSENANLIKDPKSNLIEYRQNGGKGGKFRLLLLPEFPLKISAEAQQTVRDLAAKAKSTGLLVIVHPGDYVDERQVAENGLTSALGIVDGALVYTGRTPAKWVWLANRGEGKQFSASQGEAYLFNPRSDQQVAEEFGEIFRKARLDNEVSMPLLPLNFPSEDWSQSTKDGVVLTSLAKGGNTIYELKFDDAHPHAVLTGTSGSGKSNFILSMIYGMSQRYAPEELQIHLLDFKEGLSVASLAHSEEAPEYLPHARILGVNSDRQFGVEVLHYVENELTRRAALFKRLPQPASNIIEYRERSGHKMPRVVFIIDEYQILFNGKDQIAKDSAKILANILAQGRAYGVHMLLSTQALGNVDPDLKRLILAQSKIRLALLNTPTESGMILASGSTLAAELAKYEIIINDNMGHEDANRRVMTPAVPNDVALACRTEWTKRFTEAFGGNAPVPMIFNGEERLSFNYALSAINEMKGSADKLAIGRPITVSVKPAAVELIDNIAIVGRDTSQNDDLLMEDIFDYNPMSFGDDFAMDNPGDQIVGSIQSLTLSIAAQARGRKTVFHIINGLKEDTPEYGNIAALATVLKSFDECELDVVNRRQIYDLFDGLDAKLAPDYESDGARHIVVIIDAGAFPELDSASASKAQMKTFNNVLRQGASHDINTIIWWRDPSAAKSTFGFEKPPFASSILFGCDSSGLRTTPVPCPDAMTPWMGQDNRALCCTDLNADGLLVVPVLPFDKSETEMVINAVRRDA